MEDLITTVNSLNQYMCTYGQFTQIAYIIDFQRNLKLLEIIDSTYTTQSDCKSIKFEIND